MVRCLIVACSGRGDAICFGCITLAVSINLVVLRGRSQDVFRQVVSRRQEMRVDRNCLEEGGLAHELFRQSRLPMVCGLAISAHLSLLDKMCCVVL